VRQAVQHPKIAHPADWRKLPYNRGNKVPKTAPSMFRSRCSSQIITSVRAFLRLCRSLVLLAGDTIVLLRKRHNKSQTIALVRLDAIGDFILWIDAAQELARHYRAAGNRVVLIGNDAWAKWAQQLSIFDEVLPINPHSFRTDLVYRLHTGVAVRRIGMESIINSTHSRVWLTDDSIVRLSGAPKRIGSVGDHQNTKPWQKRMTDRWYTDFVVADEVPRTELERNAEFVRNFIEPGFRTKLPDLSDACSHPLSESFLAESHANPYYILFPGAGWKGREWPVANFARIADLLTAQTGWLGIICGGRSDAGTAVAIQSQSGASLLNWTGRTSLDELARMIAHARFVLTNETSAVHLAAAFGVPAVCILGGGHYGRFLPYRVETQAERPLPTPVTHDMPCFGCNWQCIHNPPPNAPMPCIEGISTEAVWNHISAILGLPAEKHLVTSDAIN
jgi:ADP-heptose:LPS heptosyltransferase